MDDRTARTVRLGESDLVLRDVTPGDMTAVLALHTQVFGPGADAPWFAWKYGSGLRQGCSQALGAWHGDALVAHCAGLPRTLWQRNRSVRGMQIGDVMVHPAWRGILSRRGLFFHISKGFYDSRLGPEKSHPFQLGYGFPNERHAKLGVMLGLGIDGGPIEALHWTTGGTPSLPWSWRWYPVAPSSAHFDRVVNSAWRSMLTQASELTLGQRDADYLRWRYVDRPRAGGVPDAARPRYCFFELRRRWPTTSAGMAVLDLRSTAALWLDWVGPTHLMPLASQACRQEAARCGATELTAWASPAVAQQLEGSGITRREVCAFLTMPKASDLVLQDVPKLGWWLMGGDTDFL